MDDRSDAEGVLCGSKATEMSSKMVTPCFLYLVLRLQRICFSSASLPDCVNGGRERRRKAMGLAVALFATMVAPVHSRHVECQRNASVLPFRLSAGSGSIALVQSLSRHARARRESLTARWPHNIT